MTLWKLLSVAALSLSACHSAEGDFRKVCNVEPGVRAKIPDFDQLPAADRMIILWNVAGEEAHNPDVREALEALAHVNPQDKGRILRQAAAEHGVSNCALADVIDALAPAKKAAHP